MPGSDFVYYSMRCKKQREMAHAAPSDRSKLLHKKIAAAYAEKAALAMCRLENGMT